MNTQEYSLSEVSQLYTSLSQAGMEVALAEEAMKHKRDHYDRLSAALADMLTSVGMSEMKMSDGKHIVLKTDYFGSASQERMPQILDYLTKTGQRGLARVKKLSINEADLPNIPNEFSDRISYEINTNTLKSQIREWANTGGLTEEVRNLFAVHQVNKVEIK